MLPSFPLAPLLCLALVTLTTSAVMAEQPQGKIVASASVVYGKNQEGLRQTGLLWLIMTEGKTVKFEGEDCYQGKFSLHLERIYSNDVTTELSPLCLPLTSGGDLIFSHGYWPIVTSDLNKDGISEINFGQRGNSWGDHYMLFTFNKEGEIEAMTVDDEKKYNYLHPEAGRPSTNLLLETKEGFKHTFTERGTSDEDSGEVYIHFRWNAKESRFEESKRTPIE